MKEPDARPCSMSLIVSSSAIPAGELPCVSFCRVFVSSSASICVHLSGQTDRVERLVSREADLPAWGSLQARLFICIHLRNLRTILDTPAGFLQGPYAAGMTSAGQLVLPV